MWLLFVGLVELIVRQAQLRQKLQPQAEIAPVTHNAPVIVTVQQNVEVLVTANEPAEIVKPAATTVKAVPVAPSNPLYVAMFLSPDADTIGPH